ncbi:MAG: hypothetical protein RSB67_00420 [Clostridia bacterium]
MIQKSNVLKDIGNPYGINIKKYIIIKYIISTIILIILLTRKTNIVYSIIYFMAFYFLPDILIIIYRKNEDVKITNQISNIVQSQILSLSSGMPIYESLKASISSISNKRFKFEFSTFLDNYQLFNFNIQKAIYEFEKKFTSIEFKMYISILLQSEKEGKILENLEIFSDTLDFSYFKYLKFKSVKKIALISVCTIVSLLNSFLVIMYPIGIQISENLIQIFK